MTPGMSIYPTWIIRSLDVNVDEYRSIEVEDLFFVLLFFFESFPKHIFLEGEGHKLLLHQEILFNDR